MTEQATRTIYATPEQAEIYTELARPFTPKALKWKVQANPKDENKSALVVGYIDARHVAARLSYVAPGQWTTDFKPVVHAQVGGPEAGKAVLCILTVCGVSRVDVGLLKGGDNADDEVRIKGGYSDAFKRVAVQFGVFESGYAIPKMWVGKDQGAKIVTLDSGKCRAYIDNDKAEAYLRGQYERWLRDVGVGLYGEPIDHGDVEGSQGDVDAGDIGAAPAGVRGDDEHPFGPPSTDDQMESLGRALDYLGELSGVSRAAMFSRLNEKFDSYVPRAAALALGEYAAQVKKQSPTPEEPAE